MIAEVAFDAPLPPFSYAVPSGWTLAPGQRVLAPLRGAARVGMVVSVREATGQTLKEPLRVVDGLPVVGPAQLDLLAWIAAQSLSPLGSTAAALLPPAITGAACPAPATASPSRPRGSTVLVGAGRERRLLDRLAALPGPALVLTADIEGAARWAHRLAKVGPVVRLDSGVSDESRADGWRALAAGAVRLAVGTRSALLAPLVEHATLVLVDEHEPDHKPPGAPRMHARDIVLERARREGHDVLLTAATPSVETWMRVTRGEIAIEKGPAPRWPSVAVADTRGILRREALTPALARAVRETLAAGRRVFLGVSRASSSLACDDCGTVLRCEACALALAHARSSQVLTCRLCGAAVTLPDRCPACQGHRLSPFGWGAERVEHAVRRRFPHARVARYDPDARGARGEAQRAAAAAAQVVIGTRGALRLFGPSSLGLAGFVSPDQLLRLPDFRAGERAFALLWAAAERVMPDGAVVVQSQHPEHYVLEALRHAEIERFYAAESGFRAELGYPPFRRLAVIGARSRTRDEGRARIAAVEDALRGVRGVVAYPPALVRGRTWRMVVKGPDTLPVLLGDALRALPARGRDTRDIMEVEMDPVEWQG